MEPLFYAYGNLKVRITLKEFCEQVSSCIAGDDKKPQHLISPLSSSSPEKCCLDTEGSDQEVRSPKRAKVLKRRRLGKEQNKEEEAHDSGNISDEDISAERGYGKFHFIGNQKYHLHRYRDL